MAVCRYCAEQIDADQEYCPVCGEQLVTPGFMLTDCPYCREKVVIGSSVCNACNGDLNKNTQRRTRRFAIAVLAFVVLHVLLWTPAIIHGLKEHPRSFRPMAEWTLSLLSSLGFLILGAVFGSRQLVGPRPRRYAIATYLLGAVPLVLTFSTIWFIHEILKVEFGM